MYKVKYTQITRMHHERQQETNPAPLQFLSLNSTPSNRYAFSTLYAEAIEQGSQETHNNESDLGVGAAFEPPLTLSPTSQPSIGLQLLTGALVAAPSSPSVLPKTALLCTERGSSNRLAVGLTCEQTLHMATLNRWGREPLDLPLLPLRFWPPSTQLLRGSPPPPWLSSSRAHWGSACTPSCLTLRVSHSCFLGSLPKINYLHTSSCLHLWPQIGS